ncbi:MAG: hypothetical protein KAW89_11210, partial [Armatimonadetes bacterium]|nr:hypothetical protein [Armatimonadota bacterium]
PARAYDNAGAWETLKNEQGYLVNTPWGDIFDVFTTRRCRTLDGYRVVIMVGTVDIDEKLAGRLRDYVKAGGSLVINAEQAAGRFPVGFLGVELTGEKGQAQAAVCKLDQQSLKSAPFQYHKAVLAGAEPLVVEPDNGDVLVSKHTVGEGCVILTTPSYLLDENNHALPLLSHLLDHLTSNLLPIRVSPGAQFLLNKTERGWVVGQINNKGVYKPTVGPPQVKPEEEVMVMINLEGKATTVEEWLTQQELDWRTQANATTITISIPAGDVRIVEITL